MNHWEWSLLEEKEQVDHVMIGGVEVRTGHRVRLNPHEGGDILDLALRGQVATVESIEQDYEGQQHICVVLEDDPGRDLGMMRQPGHRFFFKVTEIEPLPEEEQGQRKTASQARILIAGIGNIFLGDDGFGVEVVRRLAGSTLPEEVRVVDFGIRGLDLVYALQDRYETTILIDAYPHGQPPGTVSVVELDPNEAAEPSGNLLEPHSMHPMNVLRMASATHGPLKRVMLIGCEPATLGGDEGQMGLSQPVEVAVEQAVKTTEALIRKILEGKSV
ncbi:hydrogenase maturation protease [Tunturibacter empetritectus]|uniref:Hydrogenase maturation protease n=1 Tax=Tunturiibacter empetritectus TaxID=3069691 RepID=A0A7W8IGY8_9BACT|nr:hydrogenase maturation protease [Edaphobacter lichenicola]MBB5316999.1 hydrogenase maturation protease [Edaphobacter lichenicola]